MTIPNYFEPYINEMKEKGEFTPRPIYSKKMVILYSFIIIDYIIAALFGENYLKTSHGEDFDDFHDSIYSRMNIIDKRKLLQKIEVKEGILKRLEKINKIRNSVAHGRAIDHSDFVYSGYGNVLKEHHAIIHFLNECKIVFDELRNKLHILIDKNLTQGLISKKEYEAFMRETLPYGFGNLSVIENDPPKKKK